MRRQTTRISQHELLWDPDLSFLFLQEQTIAGSIIHEFINGRHHGRLSIEDASGVSVLNQDLILAAEKLVADIKKGEPREGIPRLLIDPDSGLAARGHSALNLIFSEQAKAYIEHSIGNAKHKPPIMDVMTNLFFLPWEWLYDDPPQNYIGIDDLYSVLEPFWGFNRIICRRGLPKGDDRPAIRLIQTPPRVGLVIDERLEYARNERDWFISLQNNNLIELVTLELDPDLEDWPLIETVNAFLSNRDLDVLHFACHADFDKVNPLDSFFTVGNGRIYKIRNFNQSPAVSLQCPFIFLNACSTGRRNPMQTFDIVGLFAKAGARNVIAIESSVQSQVAFRLTELFYPQLLAGIDIGAALINARCQLVRDGKSSADVVSLFYSYYADATLRFANSI